jgi:hypothetical protein
MSTQLEIIRQEVELKTGLSFSKYQRPELVEAMTETVSSVTSPVAFMKHITKPLVLTVLSLNIILGLLFLMTDLSIWKFIFLMLFGNIGFPLSAIAWGTKGLVEQIAKRTGDTLEQSLDLADDALNDLETVDYKKIRASDIVRGILFVVVVPTLSEAIKNKTGFLSKPIIKAFDQMSGMLSNAIPKLLKEKEITEDEIEENEIEENEIEENEESEESQTKDPNFDKTRYAKLINNMRPNIRPYIENKVLGVITLPLKVFSYASAGTTGFLFLIIFIF